MRRLALLSGLAQRGPVADRASRTVVELERERSQGVELSDPTALDRMELAVRDHSGNWPRQTLTLAFGRTLGRGLPHGRA